MNPENLTQSNEFSNEFYRIIDDIEDSIINGDTINKILNRYNLAPNINKNYGYWEDREITSDEMDIIDYLMICISFLFIFDSKKS